MKSNAGRVRTWEGHPFAMLTHLCVHQSGQWIRIIRHNRHWPDFGAGYSPSDHRNILCSYSDERACTYLAETNLQYYSLPHFVCDDNKWSSSPGTISICFPFARTESTIHGALVFQQDADMAGISEDNNSESTAWCHLVYRKSTGTRPYTRRVADQRITYTKSGRTSLSNKTAMVHHAAIIHGPAFSMK